jgi:hypothetical protein
MTAQAHRINIEAGQQPMFEALSTAEGWSCWFTPEVTGDFTDGSQIVCRLNGRSPVRLRVTSVQPGSAIAFEALEGPFAAPRATTSIQLASADDGRTAVALRYDTPPIQMKTWPRATRTGESFSGSSARTARRATRRRSCNSHLPAFTRKRT